MKTKRKSLGKKIRFEVFKRDGFCCQYCGSTPPKVILEVDHIVPVKDGGDNDEDNLTTSCFDCNRGKGANSLSSIPQLLSDKAKAVQEAEAQLRAYHEILSAKKQRIEDEAFQVAEIFEPGCSVDGYSIRRLTSIKGFIDRLHVFSVEEAAEIAVGRFSRGSTAAFKYFCGVCWNRVNGENNG